MIDFKTIGVNALTNAEHLLSVWLPDGKRSGREWVARNPTRTDGKAGSFSVNMETGRWADFATGHKGGDLVSLLAYLKRCSQKEAAKALAGECALPVSCRKPFRPPGVKTPAPVREKPERADIPAPTSKPYFRHPKLGKPSAKWKYRNADGVTVGFACRFDEGNGGKVVIPLSWDGKAWCWKAMPEPRPLYNLPKVLKRRKAFVIVVEGEKATDAARKLLPEAVTTTWAGGCNAWKKTDWNPLKGRKVFLWADADEPGRETMQELKSYLLEIGSRSVVFPMLPEWLPKGWDAADAMAEGWTRDDILWLLAGRRRC